MVESFGKQFVLEPVSPPLLLVHSRVQLTHGRFYHRLHR